MFVGGGLIMIMNAPARRNSPSCASVLAAGRNVLYCELDEEVKDSRRLTR